MPTVRKSPKEVQVDLTVYTFERVLQADAFEACVAALDVSHCLIEHPAVDIRPVVEPPPAAVSDSGEN